MARNALGHQVNTSSRSVINRLERVMLAKLPFRLRWEWMLSTNRFIERPAEDQKGIANRFGIEAPTRKCAEPLVVWIAIARFRSETARLLIRARKHDQPVHALD